MSFYENIQTDISYEILIILNACTDNSLEVAKKHSSINHRVKFFEEAKLGHSNARNTGWTNAQAPFVFYMDDDAYPDPNLVNELHTIISSHKIDCISGRTIYWDYQSPKWIPSDLVEVPIFTESFGLLPKGGFINGCACGFTTEALEKAGGFNPDVGMKGNTIGYYDEIYMQEMLQALGFDIHYAPQLLVHHQSHQKTVIAFLKAHYAHGKSRKALKTTPFISNLYSISISMIKASLLLIPNWIQNGIKAGTVKSYTGVFYYLGLLIG